MNRIENREIKNIQSLLKFFFLEFGGFMFFSLLVYRIFCLRVKYYGVVWIKTSLAVSLYFFCHLLAWKMILSLLIECTNIAHVDFTRCGAQLQYFQN